MRLKDLDETFRDDLDLEFAAGYLEAALKENNLPAFLALRDERLKAAASETELGRESLYKHCQNGNQTDGA